MGKHFTVFIITIILFAVHERIGFGAIDLFALKTAAKHWKHVPEKRRCVVEAGDGLKEYVNCFSCFQIACEFG